MDAFLERLLRHTASLLTWVRVRVRVRVKVRVRVRVRVRTHHCCSHLDQLAMRGLRCPWQRKPLEDAASLPIHAVQEKGVCSPKVWPVLALGAYGCAGPTPQPSPHTTATGPFERGFDWYC